MARGKSTVRIKDKNGDEADRGWGSYMDSKRQKLLDQFNENAEPLRNTSSQIFRGVVIYVNGYTNPSADILRQHMAKYGGQYSTYLTKDVTHVVATNLCWTKIDKLNDKSPKIVHPQWITACIKESKLLPDDDYLLYRKKQNNTHSILKFVNQTKKAVEEDSAKKNLEIESKTVKTAKDPNFIDEFYARSRLHMISTWCQEMKQLVKKWKSDAVATFKGRELILEHEQCVPTTSSKPPIGLLKHPELKGHPIAITHSKGKGPSVSRNESDKFHSFAEIASCSYEARHKGVKNGMFLGDALKLCPELKTLSYDFEDYKRVSKLFYETVASFTLDIEAVSCDEMFVNMKDIILETNSDPLIIAATIRRTIFEATGCTSSAGLGRNKLIARLATRKAKPNGQYIVRDVEIDGFLGSTSVHDLPGVGHSLAEKMGQLNVENCMELRRLSMSTLKNEFGAKIGERLYNFARGVDNRTLPEASNVDSALENADRKSVSCDVNYGIRFSQIEEIENFLKQLAGEVSKRLQTSSSKGKTITLKCLVRAKDAPIETKKFMGCGIVDSFTRSCSLLDYTDDQCVIFRECMKLFRSLDQICISDLRGIGISMHKLSFKSSNVTCARTSEESLLKFLKKDVGSEKVIDEDHIEIVLEKSTKPTTIKRKLEVDKINCKKSNVSENSSTIEDEPSFLGLISLEEIKPAMSQWVVQCDVPSAEDSNLCVDFLIQLVQKHRLTFCYELLKFIFMQISLKQSHNRWKDFYRASTEIVQDLVKDKYSYPLKLPSFD